MPISNERLCSMVPISFGSLEQITLSFMIEHIFIVDDLIGWNICYNTMLLGYKWDKISYPLSFIIEQILCFLYGYFSPVFLALRLIVYSLRMFPLILS